MKKGEKTRLEILEATLSTIVEYGVHGTTFRAVAAKAGFKTPLVAYHFPDRTKLLRDAVSLLFSRQAAIIDKIFKNLYIMLESYSPRDLKKPLTRAEIALKLTDAVTDIMLNYYLSAQVEPKCLLILKFDTHPDPALVHVRNLGQRALQVYLTELVQRLNSEHPSQDARLINAVFIMFELESIKNNNRNYQYIHQTLWLTFSRVLNVAGEIETVASRVREKTTPAYEQLLSQGNLFTTKNQ